MLSVTHIMPVLVLLSVVGVENATVHDPKPYTQHLRHDKTPTKSLYGPKYAVYNQQF